MTFAYIIKDGKDIFMLRPGNQGDSSFYIFFIEAFYTAIFITLILHLKYMKVAPSSDSILGCICVAITLYCLIGLCGDVSKACFNPAVGISVPFFHAMYASRDDPSHLDYVFSYIFGPIVGGLIATQIMERIAFKYPNNPE